MGISRLALAAGPLMLLAVSADAADLAYPQPLAGNCSRRSRRMDGSPRALPLGSGADR